MAIEDHFATEDIMYSKMAFEEESEEFADEEEFVIQVDEENGNEDWWYAARESTNCPEVVQIILDVGGEYGTVVTKQQMEEIYNWASLLPGWDDGPEYAPNPLIINPL